MEGDRSVVEAKNCFYAAGAEALIVCRQQADLSSRSLLTIQTLKRSECFSGEVEG
jgi:hypothetical protein